MIRVGAATDVVLNERFRRTEGALAATQAAVAEGIVPGGGTALLRRGGARRLELEGDYAPASTSCASVLAEPLYWIASNAGYDGHAAIDQVRAMPAGRGLDALTGEFGDLSTGRRSTRCGSRGSASSTRPRWRRCCSRPRRSSPRS